MSTHRIDKEIVDGQQSIVIESTLPPTTSLETLEGEGATVLVFSHDAALARVIRGVGADRYPIRIINEWNDLLEQIGRGNGRIVLLDVDALSDDVEDSLAAVNRCADWLVMIIAAKQQQAQDFMRFWSERRIHRLLIKPAAAGITRLLLESAFARFIELRELHENTDAMEIPHELVAEEEAKERRRWLWPLLVFGCVAIAGAAVWFSGVFTSQTEPVAPVQVATIASPETRPEPQQPNPATPQPESTTVTAPEVTAPVAESTETSAAVDPWQEILQLAELAQARGAVVEPVGDSALDYYASILIDDPNHEMAGARLGELLEAQFATAQTQLLEQDFAGAQVTLDHIARADPSGSRLQFLREQLNRLQAGSDDSAAALAAANDIVAAEPAPVAVAPVQPTELQSMLTLSRLRLDDGLLVEPIGDSARDYLMRALDLGGEQAALAPLAQQFVTQALAVMPQALAEGDIGVARSMYATAEVLNVLTPAMIAFEPQIGAAIAAEAAAENSALHAQALLRIDDEIYTGREDSAIALLNLLRERNADEALITDIEASLSDAIVNSVAQAIAAGAWNQAEQLLADFSSAGLESATMPALAQEVEVARRQESFLRETAPVGELTLLEAPPAVYPRNALNSETTGWVDLRFTVDMAGATRDIEVVGAEPQGQFEDAAVTALTRWEFVPFEFNERVYERRVRLRMRFQLD